MPAAKATIASAIGASEASGPPGGMAGSSAHARPIPQATPPDSAATMMLTMPFLVPPGPRMAELG